MPPTIEFASLGMWDSLILMIMALVVFGPRRLPQIGRQIGKLMYEFRKASNDFKFQMEEELRSAEEADRRKKEEERLRALTQTIPATTPAADATSVAGEASAGATGILDPVVIEPRVMDGQFPVPSPYPGEELYPSSLPPAMPSTEETFPRIQPPSTGEPVPASWPGGAETPIEIPVEIKEELPPSASDIAYAEARAEAYAEAEARAEAARARAEALAKAEAARAQAAALAEAEANSEAPGKVRIDAVNGASATPEQSSTKPVKHNG